jgi:hypothetical protein
MIECLFSVFEPIFDDFEDKIRKYFKKKLKKFGGLKIMRTFAARLRENGTKSSLKRLKESTRSKYREIQFIEKR